MLLGILTAILVSYIGPVRGYLAQQTELVEERQDLAELREQRDRLADQLDALSRERVVAARARELGLALPGERTYVVRGLPEPASQPEPQREEPDDDGLLGWLPLAL